MDIKELVRYWIQFSNIVPAANNSAEIQEFNSQQ